MQAPKGVPHFDSKRGTSGEGPPFFYSELIVFRIAVRLLSSFSKYAAIIGDTNFERVEA